LHAACYHPLTVFSITYSTLVVAQIRNNMILLCWIYFGRSDRRKYL